MCITGEKSLQTIWDELSLEYLEFVILELQYLHITVDSIWNTVRDREMDRNHGSPPHERVTVSATRRPKQGNDIENQILVVETGRYSVSTAYRKDSGSLQVCILDFKRIQKDE